MRNSPHECYYGKEKFGGPFTEEEVEDVKTVLCQLIKAKNRNTLLRNEAIDSKLHNSVPTKLDMHASQPITGAIKYGLRNLYYYKQSETHDTLQISIPTWLSASTMPGKGEQHLGVHTSSNSIFLLTDSEVLGDSPPPLFPMCFDYDQKTVIANLSSNIRERNRDYHLWQP